MGFLGIVLRVLYKPVQRTADFFLTLYFLLTVFVQLAAVYYSALKSPFVSMIAIVLFLHYWFYFAPFYPNSDAAGNGMARSF